MTPGKYVVGVLSVLGLCEAVDALAANTTAVQSQPSTSGNTGTPAPKTLETIVVADTHIRGIDLETRHPVLTIDRIEIERTSAMPLKVAIPVT